MREQPVVLCLQDTTELDFKGRQMAGAGPLSYESQRGMYLHATYAVTPSREPLGVVVPHTAFAGAPQLLVHAIEVTGFAPLGMAMTTYIGWQDLETKLAALTGPVRRIAMEYSPNNAIPYASWVDAGTKE